MKEFVISQAKAETAVLVGLVTKEQDEAKTKEYLDELEFLADTAGAVTVKRFTQKVGGPNQTTYVGSGKLQEIKEYIGKKEEEYAQMLQDFKEEFGANTQFQYTSNTSQVELKTPSGGKMVVELPPDPRIPVHQHLHGRPERRPALPARMVLRHPHYKVQGIQ